MVEEFNRVFRGQEDDVWLPVRLWRLPLPEDLAFPSRVFGPFDLAPLFLDASDCFSVRMTLFRFENSMRDVGWMV